MCAKCISVVFVLSTVVAEMGDRQFKIETDLVTIIDKTILTPHNGKFYLYFFIGTLFRKVAESDSILLHRKMTESDSIHLLMKLTESLAIPLLTKMAENDSTS